MKTISFDRLILEYRLVMMNLKHITTQNGSTNLFRVFLKGGCELQKELTEL